MSTRPPERPCTSCGQMCRSKNQVCMACNTGHTTRYVDGEPVALEGGSWKPDHSGIQRWVPDPIAPPTEPPVACSTCYARADQTCRTKKGHRTNDHDGRFIPRQCSCGAAVEPRHKRCTDCRRALARANQARYVSRKIRSRGLDDGVAA